MAFRPALPSLLLLALTLGVVGCSTTHDEEPADSSLDGTGGEEVETDAAQGALHEWRFEEGMYWEYDVEPLIEGETLPEGAFDQMRWEVLAVDGDEVRMERTYFVGGNVSEIEEYAYFPAQDGSLRYTTNEDFASAFGSPGEVELLEQEDWEVPPLKDQTEPVSWEGVNLYADVDDESVQYGYRAAFERQPPVTETVDVLGEPMEALCYETHVEWHWQYGAGGEQEFDQDMRECTVMGMGNITTELTTNVPDDVPTLAVLTDTNALR